MSFEWYGDQVSAHFAAKAAKGIEAATDGVVEAVKVRVGVSGQRVSGKTRKGRPTYRTVHSQPGEAPYRQTGDMQDSVHREPGDGVLEQKVVVDAESPQGFPYPSFLEMELDRPFLRPTLDEAGPRIVEVVTSGEVSP